MATNRITPDQVDESFQRTGLTPCAHLFCVQGEACGLGAVYMDKCGLEAEGMRFRYQSMLFALGISESYEDGFSAGFAGSTFLNEGEEFRLGNKDGKAARKRIFREAV